MSSVIKKWSYFLIFFLFSVTYLKAQNPDSAKFSIGFLVPQLLVKEVVVTSTVPVSRSFSFTFLGGYRFKTGGSDRVSGIGHGNVPGMPDQLMVNPFAQAVRIGFMPKWYPGSRGTFFATEIFYRYWWINNELFAYENGDAQTPEPIVKQNSIFQHVIGLKLWAGGQLGKVKIGQRNSINFQLMAGYSFRYKFYTYKKGEDFKNSFWIAPQLGLISEIVWGTKK